MLLRHLLAGLALGGLTGGVARGFMALLTQDPEFTWSGTSLIVLLFGVAGLSFAAAYDLKQRHRSRWWKVVALPSVMICLGQGLLLVPGYVGFALARSPRRLPRIIGHLVLLAFAGLVIVPLRSSDDPVTLRTLAGVVLMFGVCAAVAAAARAALTGWSALSSDAMDAAGEAQADRGQRTHPGRDRGSAEDPFDLHHGGVEQRLPVGLVGQGGNGGVVLVQADGREQGETDDHADHPRDDDEGTRGAVRVLR